MVFSYYPHSCFLLRSSPQMAPLESMLSALFAVAGRGEQGFPRKPFLKWNENLETISTLPALPLVKSRDARDCLPRGDPPRSPCAPAGASEPALNG